MTQIYDSRSVSPKCTYIDAIFLGMVSYNPDWGTDWKACNRRDAYDKSLGIDSHQEISAIRAERQRLSLKGPIKILDIGCGNALYLDQILHEQKEMGNNDVKVVGLSVNIMPHNIKNYVLGTVFPYLPFQDNEFDMIVAWQAPIIDRGTGILKSVIYDSIRISRPGGRIYMEQMGLDSHKWYKEFVEKLPELCESCEIKHTKTGDEILDESPIVNIRVKNNPESKFRCDSEIKNIVLENFLKSFE
jgi:SAM-dependent methyltransferase